MAMTAVICDPQSVVARAKVHIACAARDRELLVDWLRALVDAMDKKLGQQIENVATLPGVAAVVDAVPDALWGCGFPIGGVAVFDAADGGVVSSAGVGFDIACGVRTLHTGLPLADVQARRAQRADLLFARIPAGGGSTSCHPPGCAGNDGDAGRRTLGGRPRVWRRHRSGRHRGAWPRCRSRSGGAFWASQEAAAR